MVVFFLISECEWGGGFRRGENGNLLHMNALEFNLANRPNLYAFIYFLLDQFRALSIFDGFSSVTFRAISILHHRR